MFIFFDIDGTLIDHERASAIASIKFLDHFADVLPYSHDEFPSIWNAILNKHFEMFSRGEVSFTEQRYNRMKELFSNPVLSAEEADASFQIYLQHYELGWSLFDDVMPCLKRLSKEPLGLSPTAI